MTEHNTGNTGSNETELSAAQADWKRTIEVVSGLFGKLVYLSGLRDDSTGTYRHYGFAQRYSEGATNTVLQANHEQAFARWLTLPVEEQRHEIERYWASEGSDPNLAVQNWLILEPYRRLAPASARREARELYLADIELVLEIIRKQISSASSSS